MDLHQRDTWNDHVSEVMVFGPHEVAAQDKAQACVGLTVPDNILTTGSTLCHPEHCPCSRNYVKLFPCVMSLERTEPTDVYESG